MPKTIFDLDPNNAPQPTDVVEVQPQDNTSSKKATLAVIASAAPMNFADATARDVYYTANPTFLIEGTHCTVNHLENVYLSGAWLVRSDAAVNKNGATNLYCSGNATSSKNITHGLGATPNWIRINARWSSSSAASGTPVAHSSGTKILTTYACSFDGEYYDGTNLINGTGSGSGSIIYIMYVDTTTNYSIIGTVTLTSTQIQLSCVNNGPQAGNIMFDWECGL